MCVRAARRLGLSTAPAPAGHEPVRRALFTTAPSRVGVGGASRRALGRHEPAPRLLVRTSPIFDRAVVRHAASACAPTELRGRHRVLVVCRAALSTVPTWPAPLLAVRARSGRRAAPLEVSVCCMAVVVPTMCCAAGWCAGTGWRSYVHNVYCVVHAALCILRALRWGLSVRRRPKHPLRDILHSVRAAGAGVPRSPRARASPRASTSTLGRRAQAQAQRRRPPSRHAPGPCISGSLKSP